MMSRLSCRLLEPHHLCNRTRSSEDHHQGNSDPTGRFLFSKPVILCLYGHPFGLRPSRFVTGSGILAGRTPPRSCTTSLVVYIALLAQKHRPTPLSTSIIPFVPHIRFIASPEYSLRCAKYITTSVKRVLPARRAGRD